MTKVANSEAESFNPLVTAVIPTRNRPQVVVRAVNSALAQTWTSMEVVVVVDGPDAETIAALDAYADGRVKVVALPKGVGGSEARNSGLSKHEAVG